MFPVKTGQNVDAWKRREDTWTHFAFDVKESKSTETFTDFNQPN